MQTIDDIIAATIRSVRASGMLTENVIMGVVSAVGTNGTITVTRPGNAGGPDANAPAVAADVYPKVRLLGHLSRPLVGDKVEIVNSQSGWLCLGVLRNTNAPKILSGTVVTSTSGGTTTNAVVFSQPFASSPRITMSGESTVPQNYSLASLNVTTSGFDLRCVRTTTSSTTVHWIATDL